jgi:DNA-directed RNA polymerase specialized sigma24 family protein
VNEQGSNQISSGNRVDYFVRSYGDLIFDLCETLISTPLNAQIAFRSILKKLKSGSRFHQFHQHERGWVLRITCEKLLELCRHHGRRITPEEQINLDSNDHLSVRLKQFDIFFRRLMPEDQILLILKDKYGIAYSEIATAMATPEGSLKVRRQQALRTLEEWLWKTQ